MLFLIPVLWYLFLQLFGSNNFSLALPSDVPPECESYQEITIVSKNDSLSVVETNYMNRVIYAVEKREVELVYTSPDFFSCINQAGSDLALVSEESVWSVYELSRDGVDQLLTELDILLLQQTYGKGTDR